MSNTPAVVNLGTCWGTPDGEDLSSPSYMASGNLCVAEAILRRWTTTAGELIDDPNYGRNVTSLISSDLSPQQIAYEQLQLAAEAQKDERVLSATVTLTFGFQSGSLTVNASILTAAGPFQFVASVSAIETTLTVTP
jgi:hypothetical protein